MAKEDNEALEKINTEIHYERKFGSGGLIETYGHEVIGFKLTGPFKDVKDGKDLPKLCFNVIANMKILADRINSKKAAELTDAAKKPDPPKAPPKAESVKKKGQKEPVKEPKKKENKDDPFEDDFSDGPAQGDEPVL